MRRRSYTWDGRRLRRSEPTTVPPGHCDVCGQDGFLELAPLFEGATKWACVVCRATYRRRHAR